VEAVARVGSLRLKILSMVYTKRILFKVSNQLYLKLKWGARLLMPRVLKALYEISMTSNCPFKTNKRASEQKN
jgi:hypothetical protein